MKFGSWSSRTLLARVVAAALVFSACADDDTTASGTAQDGEESGSDESGEAESGSETEGGESIDEACEIRLDWEAGQGSALSFPTFEMVVEDASTASGYSVQISAEDFPDFDNYLQYTEQLVTALSSLDGFGINSEVFMRFDGAFDESLVAAPVAEPGTDTSVGIVVMPADGEPYLAALDVQLTDEGRTIISRPLWPLPPKTEVAYFVRRDFATTSGGCVGASDSMRALLSEGDGKMGTALAALEGLGVIESSDELAALQPYPTQSTTEVSFAIAQYVAGLPDEDFALSGHQCETKTEYVYCTSTFEAADFRNEDFHVQVELDAVEPHSPWTLVLHAYLPLDATEAMPTVVYGHGLDSDGKGASALAQSAAARGVATVGISALMHGDHPSLMGEEPSGLVALLGFFAADAIAGEIDSLRLRDHFHQSAYDKLYLTRVLLTGADLDGDGDVDVDPTKLAYHGVSLGGIMGVEFLTLTDAYLGANLAVPGAGLAQVMTDPAGTFEDVLAALVPSAYSDGDERRLFAMIQLVLDSADPASYAHNLLAERPSFAPQRPDLLVGNVLDDGIVPNSANWTLARALGIDIVPPTLRPVLGVGESSAAPLSHNWEGESTVGLLQFDVVEGGAVAEHSGMPFDAVGLAAWWGFLDSLFGDGPTEIIDPYEAIGLPHAG